MNEREKQLSDIKIDLLIARIYHYAMVALAVTSSSAVISSLPLAVLNVLPTWANAALAGGGLLVAPGAVHETPVTKHWLNQAEQALRDFAPIEKLELESVETEAEPISIQPNSNQENF